MGRNFPSEGQFEHKPLYEELAEEFCQRITLGRWPVGRPLKTESTIASELGVSLGTVRRAFDRLESMNLIDRTPGRGTVVLELDCKRRLASLTNVIDRDGSPIVGEIAINEVSRVEANEEVATALNIQPEEGVLQVKRTRSHLGRVFSVETAYIRLPNDGDIPGPDALWASARNFVVFGEIAVARREDARVVARADRAAMPQFGDKPDALLEVSRSLLSFEGKAIEYCVAYCQLGSNLRYRIS